MSNRCVGCGAEIPEGAQVCFACEARLIEWHEFVTAESMCDWMRRLPGTTVFEVVKTHNRYRIKVV